MLALFRIVIIVTYCILVCILGSIWCLFSPRNPKHVAHFGRMFARLSPVMGLKVELRLPSMSGRLPNAIYIANHQNNYDMITASKIIQPNTVTVGKKSLLWIPFFGQLYWLTGNLLIDRNNSTKAHSTISKVVEEFSKKTISFWMFPEGTRSRGRGLLPFKTGAFHAAIAAGVPVIPIVVSDTHNKIKFNRCNNGLVIVEMLSPVDVTRYDRESIRELMAYCQQMMATKFASLNAEVAEREAKGKV